VRPVSNETSVLAFRMWWCAWGSAEWEPGPDLLLRVDDGGSGLPEQLSWGTADGARSAVAFSPDTASCYGHRRTAAGDVVEVRGELRGRPGDPVETGGAGGYEFDTEVDDAAQRHPAPRLRLLIDDGAQAPLRWVTWRDRTGTACSISLRSASPTGNAEITDMVTSVWASAEHHDAGEVAANLIDGTSGKWFAPHDRASLEFSFPRSTGVDRYVLTSANDAPDRDPAAWILRGSADGNLWRILDARTHQSFADRHQSRTYRIAAPGSYDHYRLDIVGNNGSPHLQLEAVRFLADGSGFTGYRQRAGGDPVAYRGVRVAQESSDTSPEPLPEEFPDRRLRRLAQFHPLPAGKELVSPSGRFALRYDAEGVPVVADRTAHRTVWRAGADEQTPAAGELVLSGSVQVRLRDGGTWQSTVAADGAHFLVITDDGEVELLDDIGVSLYDSRRGFIGPQPVFQDSAPVADITLKRYLYRKNSSGAVRCTVRRKPDGSLWATNGNVSYPLCSTPLARWLEQDDTVLTWRQLPVTRGADLELCLIDRAGNLLWREGSAISTATPPPAEPHDHGGPGMGRGSRLRHQSLTSPSGSHTLLHHNDGSLVLYCNAARAPMWTTGTDWLGDSWVDLTPGGDLVLRTSCGAPVWQAGTADLGVERLAVRDDGTVALLDATGTTVWQIADHAPCSAAGHTPPRGAVLRRGQTLRNQSLTAVDGGTVLSHQPDRGVLLHRADGILVWHADSRASGAGLTLDDDGYLLIRSEDGGALEQLGGPGDHLLVVPGGEIRLRTHDGTVVWRAGQYVIDDPATITAGSSRTASSAALETLLNAGSVPIVRTDFSDDHAWQTAWRDITTPREYWDDDVTLDASLVARPEFEDWAGEELATLLSAHIGGCALLFVVDAVTLASAEHPVLVLEADPDRERPRFFRAVPHALVDVSIQLSIANLDWEDFSDHVDPDGILRTASAD